MADEAAEGVAEAAEDEDGLDEIDSCGKSMNVIRLIEATPTLNSGSACLPELFSAHLQPVRRHCMVPTTNIDTKRYQTSDGCDHEMHMARSDIL